MADRMRAVLQDWYGPVEHLRPAEVPVPTVAPDEVLVRVHATSVHPDVWHVVTGRPTVLRFMGSGVRRPRQRIPGTDVAGVVVEVGRDVTRFHRGEEVFGDTVRGFSWRNGGAYAEYVSVPETGLALKPAVVTFAQAATVPTTGYIMLLNVPMGRLRDGQRVLVNGAAGGVGMLAVQLAKARGAHVTAVDHAAKLALVSSLGADALIDYTRQDFTGDDARYDLVVDIPGNRPFSACRRVLANDGLYVLIGHDHYGREGRRWLGSLPRFAALAARSAVDHRLRRGGGPPPSKREAMAMLQTLLESGQINPVIDRTYPLDQAAEAIAYLASGQAQGRVVLTV
jgi:NADPH:quinone reductase-like Zn-dependent oxidoreductase